MLNLNRKLKSRSDREKIKAEDDRTHALIEVEAYEPMEPEKLLEWSGAMECLSLDNLKLGPSYSINYENMVRKLALLAAGLYQEIPASKHYHYYLPRGMLRHTLYMAEGMVEDYSSLRYRWRNNIGVAVPAEERVSTLLLYLAAALLHGTNFMLSSMNIHVFHPSSSFNKCRYHLSDFLYGRKSLFDICTRYGGPRRYQWEFRQDRPIFVEPSVSLRLVALSLCYLGVELTPPMVRALFEPSSSEYDDLRRSLKDAEHASVRIGSLDRSHFFHTGSYDDQIESALVYIASRTDLLKGIKLVDGRLFIPRERIDQVPSHLPNFDDFIDARQTNDFGRFVAYSHHTEALPENKEWHECEGVEGLFLGNDHRLTVRLIELSGRSIRDLTDKSERSRKSSIIKKNLVDQEISIHLNTLKEGDRIGRHS